MYHEIVFFLDFAPTIKKYKKLLLAVHYQKQAVGQIWPSDHSLQTPVPDQTRFAGVQALSTWNIKENLSQNLENSELNRFLKRNIFPSERKSSIQSS